MAEAGKRATLLAVRHGRTALNASGRFRGLEDVPLDDVGLAEVERTADGVATRLDPERPIVEIRTSPLRRGSSTAEAFGRRLTSNRSRQPPRRLPQRRPHPLLRDLIPAGPVGG